MAWHPIPLPPARFRLLVDGVARTTAAWPATLSSRVPAFARCAHVAMPQIAPHIWEGEYNGITYRIEPIRCVLCDHPLAIPEQTRIILHASCMAMAYWDHTQARWQLTDGEPGDDVSVTVVHAPTDWHILRETYPHLTEFMDPEHPQRWCLDL